MKSDADFRIDQQFGRQLEVKVHSLLTRYYPELELPAADQYHDARVHRDFGDMYLQTVIQCKRRTNIQFVSVEDFPHETIIVDTERNLILDAIPRHIYYSLSMEDRRCYLRPFHSYWIGSEDNQNYAVILPCTKPSWTLIEVYCKRSNQRVINWACPKHEAIFVNHSDLRPVLSRT